MVSTLVLDVDAFTLVRELLDDPPLPAGFVAVPDAGADPAQAAAARASAAQRLRAAGLLIAAQAAGANGPSTPQRPSNVDPGEPNSLTGNAFAEVVHPSLRAALAGFGEAGLRVEVRSWADDRAVLADLVVGVDAGIGLARLQRVTRQRGADTVEDALGVELAIFESGDTFSAVERLLPPLPEAEPAASAVPLHPVRLSWPDGLALLALLRRRDTIGADQLPVAREVLRILLSSAGLSEVSPLLERLAGPLEAAIRITLRVPGSAEGGDPIWFGYWLQCDGHVVGLRAEIGQDLAAGTPPEGSDDWEDSEGSEVENEAGVVLTIVPTDGPGLKADVMRALTDAFEVTGLAEASGPDEEDR
jgi:hypothetical protein